MAEEKLAGESDSILEEMVRRLVAAFDPDHIYLYGSRARERPGRTAITTDAGGFHFPGPSLPAGPAGFSGTLRPGSAEGSYWFNQSRI